MKRSEVGEAKPLDMKYKAVNVKSIVAVAVGLAGNGSVEARVGTPEEIRIDDRGSVRGRAGTEAA